MTHRRENLISLLIATVLLTASVAAAEEAQAPADPLAPPTPIEETSLTKFRSKLLSAPLTTKLYFEIPSCGLTFTSKDGNSTEITFRPNAPLYVGAGFAYKDFAFSASTPLAGTEDSPAQKGSTSAFDLDAHKNWKSYAVSAYFNDYQGFYRDNTSSNNGSAGGFDEIPPDNTETAYEIHPDLRLQSFGFNFMHSFGTQYNLKAINDEDFSGIVQGGSVLATVAFNRFYFWSSQPLVDTADLPAFGDESSIIGGRLYSGTVAVGYGYVFPLSSSYFAGDILFGAGPQWQSLDFPDGENRWRVVAGLKGLLNLSYNVKFTSWVMGIQIHHDQVQSDLGSLMLSSFTSSLMLLGSTTF